MKELFGTNLEIINSNIYGEFDLTQLQKSPQSKVLRCIELPTMYGNIARREHLDWLKQNSSYVHCDGARIFQSCSYWGKKPSEISQYFDSISVCFVKDLSNFMGSVLIGKKDFIDKALHYRKYLGGTLRQTGFVTAPLKYAVENYPENIKKLQ